MIKGNVLIWAVLGALLLASCNTSRLPEPITEVGTQAGGCDAWDAAEAYTGGDTVVFEGVTYRANWWTQGNNPATDSGSEGSGKPWIQVAGGCSGGGVEDTNAVTLYIDCPFSGKSISLSDGDYTADNLTVLGMPNDKVSSIRVKAGFKAEIFVDTNYHGRSLSLTSDNSCLTDNNFNDLLSSARVTRVGETNPCNTLTWTPNINYALGGVVLYPPNGRYYKVVNVTANGTEGTIPTISTYFWQPTECNSEDPDPPTSDVEKVVAAYYATFVGSVPRLKDIDSNYNLIYLFPATQAGGKPAGTLKFTAPPNGNGAWTNWAADMQLSRKQGRKFILSAGGAGQAIRFTDRSVSANFVNSVVEFYNAWGGFDGLDFNTFEADADPNAPEMIWIAKELKRRYPGFLITAPPAPWNKRDQRFCKDMLNAGAIDYCAPQYYDGPDLSDPAYLLENIKVWMDLMGPQNVVVGFGVNDELNNYWKIDLVVDTFKTLEPRYPDVKGVFDWRLDWDARDGYPFARRLGPLVTD